MNTTTPSGSAPANSPNTTTIPACLEAADLFQHELLENPPSSKDGNQLLSEARLLAARAAQVCAACAIQPRCLYDAVVEYEVAGFAGGATARQRAAMRVLLGIALESEDLDSIAGVQRAHRQLDHDEVLRLRAANPDESLESIARRLGCSLSTVKRHLRRGRSDGRNSTDDDIRPSVERVLEAFDEVTRKSRSGSTQPRVA